MRPIMLWIDDIRDPKDYGYRDCDDMIVIWCKSVYDAIAAYDSLGRYVKYISLDHDAGDYARAGGDYIKFLDWFERNHQEKFTGVRWSVHSFNPVGVQNMKAILKKNGVNC